MGNSLEQWRGAIGRFPAQTQTFKRLRKKRQKRMSAVSPVFHTSRHAFTLLLLAMAPLQGTQQKAVSTSIASNPSASLVRDVPSSPTTLTMLNVTLQSSVDAQHPNDRFQSHPNRVANKSFKGYLTKHHKVTIANEMCQTQIFWTEMQVKNSLQQCNDIETNPGPCCKAEEHFNRIENLSRQVKRDFQSKVTATTLTDKLIPVDSAGNM